MEVSADLRGAGLGVGALPPGGKVAQHGCSKSKELSITRGQGGLGSGGGGGIQSGGSRKGADEKATPLHRLNGESWCPGSTRRGRNVRRLSQLQSLGSLQLHLD